MFEFTNRKTGKTYRYKTRAAARHAADRMDAEYGAVICSLVRSVEVQ